MEILYSFEDIVRLSDELALVVEDASIAWIDIAVRA